MMFYFTVPGKPIPKGRPKFSKFGVYTPKTTVQYEKAVADAFRKKYGNSMIPEHTPIEVTVIAIMPIASGTSKKDKAALNGTYHMNQRGDIDNIVKSVLDGLNGVAYPDDVAVARIHAVKLWGLIGETRVTVSEIMYREGVTT